MRSCYGIAHGLGATPRIVIIAEANSSDVGFIVGTANVNTFRNTIGFVTTATSTNFYVIEADAVFNTNGITYNFVALA